MENEFNKPGSTDPRAKILIVDEYDMPLNDKKILNELAKVNPAILDPISDHSIEEFDKESIKVANIEMANHYWTPSKEGESMVLKYMGISVQEVIDESTGELIKKECVNFVGVINGSITHITNATSRMLQIFKNPIMCKYEKYLVTFLGSKPASSSNHKFFDWSVKQVL